MTYDVESGPPRSVKLQRRAEEVVEEVREVVTAPRALVGLVLLLALVEPASVAVTMLADERAELVEGSDPSPVRANESTASTCFISVEVNESVGMVRAETPTDYGWARNGSIPLIAPAESWVSTKWTAPNRNETGWNRTVHSDCSLGDGGGR